jgi:parallel beta-helix repeat protein
MYINLKSLFAGDLHLYFIFAGLLILALCWDRIISGLTQKKISGKGAKRLKRSGNNAFITSLILLFISLSLVFYPLIKDYTLPVLGQTRISPAPVGANCQLSRATGATAVQDLPLIHLVGNGKTDNYNAIQNAINRAGNAGGGVVQLPAGTFLINGHLVMKSNVALVGAGRTTIIKAGPNFLNTPQSLGYSVISSNGIANVTIANLTADQEGNILHAGLFKRFRGFVIHIRNSKNVIVYGVYVRNPFSYSIVADNSTRFCFKNNNTQVDTNGIYNQLDGIHILNSSFGDVLNNYVDQGHGADGDDGLVAHAYGGSVHDVNYIGNIVRGGSGGSGMQLALTDPTDTIYNLKIQNNIFWGSPRGIRTGYYGPTGGSVYNIIIGGSPANGNYIHDNTFNDKGIGDAVHIYGNGIDPFNITVTYNKACNAGTFFVGKGYGNIVRNNKGC